MCLGGGVVQDDGGAKAAAEAQLQAQREQLDYQKQLYEKEQTRIAQEKADALAAEQAAKAAREAELKTAQDAATAEQAAKEEAARQQMIAQSKTGAAVAAPSTPLSTAQKAYVGTGLPGFTDLQKKAAKQLGFDTGYLNQSNTLQSPSVSVGGRLYT